MNIDCIPDGLIQDEYHVLFLCPLSKLVINDYKDVFDSVNFILSTTFSYKPMLYPLIIYQINNWTILYVNFCQ